MSPFLVLEVCERRVSRGTRRAPRNWTSSMTLPAVEAGASGAALGASSCGLPGGAGCCCSGVAGCTFSKGFALFGSCAGLACSAGLGDSAGLVWSAPCCCGGGDWFCDQAGVSKARRQTKPAARRTRLLTLMKNMNSFPPRSLEGRKYPPGWFQLLHAVIRDHCSERSLRGQRQGSDEPCTPQWAARAQVKAGTR